MSNRRGHWWWAVFGGAVVLLLAPGTLAEKLATLAAGVCPQRPAHSIFLSGLQLPMEARMTAVR